MTAAPWSGPRAKVQLRLAAERTRALQAKLEAMQKADRKALASLVEKGKLEAARVRTEALINTDVHIELLELLELYTDTLLARFALLEHSLGAAPPSDPDPALADALAAVLYASPQTELRELHQLREALSLRLPREWALSAIDGDVKIVPDRIINKVSFATRPPDPVLIDAYIAEICGAYNVPFTPTYLPPNPTPPPPLELADGDKPDSGEENKASAPESSAATTRSEETAPKPAPAPITPTPRAKSAEDQALADLEARFASLKRK